MNKRVIISVASKQRDSIDNLENMSFVTEGKMYKKQGMYYITYRETEVTGMEGTTTTLKVKDDVLTLMRFGSVSSTMVFEKGQKHLSCYETSYGTFSMGVTAKDLNIDLNEDGGKISVEYMVELNNQDNGKSKFTIDIREAVH